jgi:hypothetical protein
MLKCVIKYAQEHALYKKYFYITYNRTIILKDKLQMNTSHLWYFQNCMHVCMHSLFQRYVYPPYILLTFTPGPDEFGFACFSHAFITVSQWET